ncbi:MAG: hypothetical protein WDZ39_00600, partial [Candidatus Spechtbacterales bacterium]
MSCIFALLGGAYWVYSKNVLAEKEEIQIINIFPKEVSHSSGWQNAEALRVQYLGGEADLEEFNTENSAHIKFEDSEVLATQIEGDQEETETDDSATVGSDDLNVTTSTEDEVSIIPIPEEDSDNVIPDKPAPDSDWGIGDPEDDTPTSTDQATSTDPSSEETEEDDTATTSQQIEEIKISNFGLEGAFGDVGPINAQLRFSFAAHPIDGDGVIPARPPLAGPDLESSNSWTPDYSGVTPQETAYSEVTSQETTDSDDKFIIEYFYNEEWTKAGELSITEEISNNTNGGYFLYALPIFNNLEELKTLDVRFTYISQGNISAANIYLDSVWVEAEIPSYAMEEMEDVSVPEERSLDIEPLPDNEGIVLGEATTTEEEQGGPPHDVPPGQLKKPALHDLLSSEISFGPTDRPRFSLRYNPPGNSSSTASTSIFKEHQFDIFDTEIVSRKGRKVNAETDITYGEDGAWNVEITPNGELTPGRHTLRFKTQEGENSYEDELEFYWGVLAVNTNKAVFISRETAYIQAAVLDDMGDTICDANVELEVVDPSGSTQNVPVMLSGECDGNNFVETPDYFAYYETDKVGEYTMKLTRLDEEGEEFYSIEDNFYVEKSPIFEVERVGPTRINPIFGYNMEVVVRASEDFQGEIVEQVPASFEVRSAGSGSPHKFEVREDDNEDRKEIVWNLEMEKGDTIELSYYFDAPNISPALFL